MEGRLRLVSGIWDEDNYAKLVLTRNDIFLSLHKGCDLLNQPLEAFRISKLLVYSRVVIAERSHAADEHQFKGLVEFAALADIPALYRKVSSISSAQRIALGRQRAADFQNRFSPARLLNQSGLFTVLDARL